MAARRDALIGGDKRDLIVELLGCFKGRRHNCRGVDVEAMRHAQENIRVVWRDNAVEGSLHILEDALWSPVCANLL